MAFRQSASRSLLTSNLSTLPTKSDHKPTQIHETEQNISRIRFAGALMEKSPRHLLRLSLSCRRITAEVTSPPPQSQRIVAMASSTESEFTNRSRLAWFHRSKLLWDEKISARVGQILAERLLRLGVNGVDLDLEEEITRPGQLRRVLSPFFESVQRSGVRIQGADKLLRP